MGPLCDLAMGLSGSLGNCAPPITWPQYAPILSPAAMLMTVCDDEGLRPQIMSEDMTSCIGLLFEGARMPLSWPMSLPLTESLCYWLSVTPLFMETFAGANLED